MRPPAIVVGDVFVNCSLQMVVTQNQPMIETFVTDSAHPTENNQLLAEAGVFGDQYCSGLEYGGGSICEAPNHRKVPYEILINRV